MLGRGSTRAVVALGLSLCILFLLPTGWRRQLPAHIKIGATVDPTKQAAIEKAALDGSWKEGLTVKTFNEMFLARVDTCLAGGPCAENNDKIVSLEALTDDSNS